ncbi:HlyD family secretion protein [Sinimarinibacterium flocculans]|uniref:HlyD family secretion protein n=1 Tax=Sinimarinibacterium flocculans TaxID=985250 RepID=UPI0035170C7B
MFDEADLFRRDAGADNSRRLTGAVVIPAPRTLLAASVFSAAIVAAAGLMLTFGQYASRQTVAGYLAPEQGLVKVFAPREGIVQAISVAEGESVVAGQQLVTVSVEQSTEDGAGVQSKVLAALRREKVRLRAQIENERALGRSEVERLEQRSLGLGREIAALRQESATARSQVSVAEALLSRMTELRRAGYLSDSDLARQEAEVLGHKRSLDSVLRAIETSETLLRELRIDRRQAPLRLEQTIALLENDLSSVERQIATADAARFYAVTAPISGTLTALQLQIGKTVNASTPLLAILSKDALLNAYLVAPSSAVGFVHIGQSVSLRYAAYPYEQYGTHSAQIKEISRTALPPGEWDFGGSPLGEPGYRIVATLQSQRVLADGKELPLQPGMLIEGDIILETRPLWRWFLAPLFAIRERT